MALLFLGILGYYRIVSLPLESVWMPALLLDER